jgi:hypothetical protein
LIDDRQQADSVYSRVLRVLQPSDEAPPASPEKCGFHLHFDIRRFWPSFDLEKRALIKSLLTRPTLQTSIVSPRGTVRIHFDTTGVNTPALIDANGVRIPGSASAYVDSVAAVFDLVWDFETRILGYPPPPSDRGLGGGNEYDVYIRELSRSFYGQTVFTDDEVIDAQRPNPTYLSYIEIDNDYIGYYSAGIRGLKVTAAHEFHHAIQVGNYGLWQNDLYFYELTSTWLEDVVYDSINDYYQYLPVYFRDTSSPFNLSNGLVEYARALWGKFVEKRFGPSLMRRTWEYMSSVRSLPAIDAALRERGTSFVRELPEFGLWHFYTGRRADTMNYYSEGRTYPEVRPLTSVEFLPPRADFTSTANSLSLQFNQFVLHRESGGSDTLTISLTNLNIRNAEQSADQRYNFTYRVTTAETDETYETLNNGLKVKLEVADPTNWKSISLLNATVGSQVLLAPYPNPFHIGKGGGGVSIPLEEIRSTQVSLSVFSPALNLVCSRVAESVLQYGKQVVLWDGKDGNGNFVPSGLYVYFIRSGGREYKGKIAVVRE